MRRRDVLCGALTGMIACGLRGNAWPQDAPSANDSTHSLAGGSKGPWRRLFLDAAVVEAQSGLQRMFHACVKHESNPVIARDKPWEGKSAITGPYVYGTVLRQAGKFRLWYQLLSEGNHVGYAESEDGVHWNKPLLDVVPFEGQPTNLVVSAWTPDKFSSVQCHNPSLIWLPNESNPMRQYALFGFDGDSRGPRVGWSHDGIHFRYEPNSGRDDKPMPLFESSDVVSFFDDPYEQRICATWKTRNRRGRAVGVAVGNVAGDWRKLLPGPVFAADDLDPDTTQIYGMPVFAYQGMYIGLPWIYAARYFRFGPYSVDKLHEAQSDSLRTIEPQIAWSWDLVNWTRPPVRKAFIERGTSGHGSTSEWDRGMIVTARAPVVVNDELWFYYGGTDKVHDEPRASAAIGLARLRLDGFCSMTHRIDNDQRAEQGWLITRREPMMTPNVLINARTGKHGSVTAEILDRKNRVVPGFSKDECHAFQGDSVRHALRWNRDHLPDSGSARDYKLRFWLSDAELFSYLPSDLDPNQPDLVRFPSEGP